jgi:hypothetical protein
MDKPTLRQMKGLNDLVADAVEAAVTRAEEMHRAIARRPYAVLKRISPVAAPMRIVEFVETRISGSVYWTVRFATRVSGAFVAEVLDRLDARGDERK